MVVQPPLTRQWWWPELKGKQMSQVAIRGVRRRKPATTELPLTEPEKRRSEPTGGWRSLAEKIAQSGLYKKGHFVPILKEAFPSNNVMWHIDRFFPYAEGGPIFIDEPTREPDILESKLKQKLLRQNGFRVVVLTPGITFDEAMLQLQGM